MRFKTASDEMTFSPEKIGVSLLSIFDRQNDCEIYLRNNNLSRFDVFQQDLYALATKDEDVCLHRRCLAEWNKQLFTGICNIGLFRPGETAYRSNVLGEMATALARSYDIASLADLRQDDPNTYWMIEFDPIIREYKRKLQRIDLTSNDIHFKLRTKIQNSRLEHIDASDANGVVHDPLTASRLRSRVEPFLSKLGFEFVKGQRGKFLSFDLSICQGLVLRWAIEDYEMYPRIGEWCSFSPSVFLCPKSYRKPLLKRHYTDMVLCLPIESIVDGFKQTYAGCNDSSGLMQNIRAHALLLEWCLPTIRSAVEQHV